VWVTLIAAINAMGRAIAPYLIFTAKQHDASRYPDLKPQSRIKIDGDGCTTNNISVAWCRHFVEQTKSRRVCSYVLPKLDGHESHKSLAFHKLCKENGICPSGLFIHLAATRRRLCCLLKRAYSKEIKVSPNINFSRSAKGRFPSIFRSNTTQMPS
jgi:hypothetical protein